MQLIDLFASSAAAQLHTSLWTSSAVIDESVDFAVSVHPFTQRARSTREMKGVQTVSCYKGWLYLCSCLATVRDVLLIKIPTRRESDARRVYMYVYINRRDESRAPSDFNRWHPSNDSP